MAYELKSNDPIPTNTYTAKITVRQRCTCGAQVWFRCSCEIVAEYEVQGWEECPPAAHPAAIRWVMEQHPGCDFVYMK